MRLVLVNGVVFALGVLVMSLAPPGHHGVTAAGTLALGLGLIVAVNTRRLRQGLTPLLTTIGTLRSRWENEQRASTARSLVSREYDGQVIAEQLRDGVVLRLSAALVGLKRAINIAPTDLALELEKVQHDARLAYVDVRKIGRRLRPETLEDLGLQSALGDLATRLTTRNPSIRLRRLLGGPFTGIDDEAALVVYRVAEQALDNVARHARAKKVTLSLDRDGDLVVLRVIDDGVGIGTTPERTGILSMRERAALRGGRLTVESLLGKGTEVRLEVPAQPRRLG